MPRTAFVPAMHGFHLANNFVNHIGVLTTRGLCGGMALAALRYFNNGRPIPTHTAADFGPGNDVPPDGSVLRDYIYSCQMDSYGPLGLLSAANWIVPFGARFEDQFNWSLNDEFPKIKHEIDAGRPVVLGLRVHQDGEPFGHQVLAIGYDESPKRVYVYDSNAPNEEWCLRLDEVTRLIHYDRTSSPTVNDAAGGHWSSYFVTGCNPAGGPPPYCDLGIQAGLTVVTQSSPPRAGERVEVTVQVRNFGNFPAHLAQLYVYVRDPNGRNRDDILGGGDADATRIAPGAARSISRVATHFGESAGRWTIGVSYLSSQGNWITLPTIASGTAQCAQLDLLPPAPAPVPVGDFVQVHRASNAIANTTQLSPDPAYSAAEAIVFITPNWNPAGQGGAYNDHATGVYFTGQAWAIYNQDRSPMPTQAAFNVRIAARGSDRVYMHQATPPTLAGHYTILDHRLANLNRRAFVSVTANWGPSHVYDSHPFGVWYTGDRWAIFHQDIAPLPSGTVFNVMVADEGASRFVHQASASNVEANSTYVDHPLTNGRPTALLLVTPNYNPHGAGGTYNNHHVGVWYDIVARRWAIFNQDLASMPIGAAFNVEVFLPPD